jgi:hypothetical protein
VVAVRTLDDIPVERNLGRIDFLKIDVEGMEPDVLTGLDITKFRPSVIVLEASRVDDCAAPLTPNRYHVEFFDGLNTYFVDDDAADVTIHHYAGEILRRGFYTDLERTLLDEPRNDDVDDSGPGRARAAAEVPNEPDSLPATADHVT